MRHFLFAYGTLQRRLAPTEIAPALDFLRPAGRGFVPGRLYDLGDYPAAAFDAADGPVHGRVYRLPDGAGAALVLQGIDRYEGVHPTDPAAGLYRRVRVGVTLRSGRRVTCWAYAHNGPIDEATRVRSGHWRGRARHRVRPDAAYPVAPGSAP